MYIPVGVFTHIGAFCLGAITVMAIFYYIARRYGSGF